MMIPGTQYLVEIRPSLELSLCTETVKYRVVRWQQLEKFKFVLDYKIKELKRQIEPREKEISDMKKQIEEMDLELEQVHTVSTPSYSGSPMRIVEKAVRVNGTILRYGCTKYLSHNIMLCFTMTIITLLFPARRWMSSIQCINVLGLPSTK